MALPLPLTPLDNLADITAQISLVDHLRSLHIGNNSDGIPNPDPYPTHETIDQAFEVFAAAFPLVQNAYRDRQLDFIPLMWHSIKANMTKSLCGPYRKAAKQLREDNTAKDSEILRLRREITAKNSEILRLTVDNTSNDTEILRLRGDITTATSEISLLREEKTSNDSAILRLTSDNTSKDTEILQLRGDITTATSEISQLREEKTSNDSEILRLTVNNTSKDTDILRLRGDIITATSEISQLREEKTSNDSEILQLTVDNTSKDTEILRLRGNLNTATSEISRLREEKTSNDSEIMRLRVENTLKDSEIQRLRDNIIKATSDISQLHEENTTNESEILRLRVENTLKDSEKHQLRSDIIAAASDISKLHQISSSKDYETLRLRDENARNATLAAERDLKIRNDAEKIGRLKAQVDHLQKSYDYHTIELLRLTTESLELRSQTVHPDGVPATGTRTQTWQAVLDDENNSMHVDLPLMRNLIEDEEVNALAITTFVKEPAMYTRVQQCFDEQLNSELSDNHPGSQVFSTHHKELIFGLKPDISIVTGSRKSATATALIAVVELKAGKLTKDAFGQLYDYLKGIKRLQPNRRMIIGLLTNLEENRFVELNCRGRITRCTRYNSVSLRTALTFLRDAVIPDPTYHPPASVFVPSLGRMDRQLGNPAFSVVAVFDIPDGINTPKFREERWVDPDFVKPYGTVQMVVKRTTPGVHGTAHPSRAPRTVANEIEFLLKIREPTKDDKLPGWKYLPSMLYHTLDFHEFAILPRGISIHPSDTRANWAKVTTDVIDALEWLHTNNIVHRDVRLDNIIWDIDHAVLIDLGTAIDISRGNGVDFNGGYVCCPPKLLGKLDTVYKPAPADDCIAVVLLVNTILFPSRWQTFQSVKLEMPGSPETRDMGKFWLNMEKSAIWGPFFKAAFAPNYDDLKKMDQLFVHLA